LSRQQGEQMAALEGSQKTITTTLNYNETTGSQVDLPNAEPGTSQVIYTVASGDLPTISSAPFSTGYYAEVYVGGRNYSGGAVTVNYRVILNGTSQTTGSASVATATSYFTVNAGSFGTNPLVVGDVLEVRLWASAATSVYWDYMCLSVVPTRMFPERRRRMLLDFSATQAYSGLPSGTSASGVVSGSYLGQSTTSLNPTGFNGAMAIVLDTANGIARQGRDTAQATAITQHATTRPYYSYIFYLSPISYRVGPDL